jgi:hypothetical protein
MITTSNAINPVPALLNARRLPARLTSEQAAEILGFKVHDIPLLVRAGLLKPLGGGPRNSVKYFHGDEVEDLARNRRWLDKATRTISRRANPSSISSSAAAAEQRDSSQS